MRPSLDITLKDLQKTIPLNAPQIHKIAKAILRREGIRSAELSVVFVTRQRIRGLNRKYLRRDHATDVLAFAYEPSSQNERHVKTKRTLCGDIIISTDAAVQNAKIYSTGRSRAIVLYLIHGILHLRGFDDHKPQDIKKMRGKEQALLDYLGAKIKQCVL